MLEIRDDLPVEFMTVHPAELYRFLRGPTLIHLPGQRSPPVFVSILLHGNEEVGLKAVQRILERYNHRELPRELMLFIGNVQAAKYGLRKLPDQDDFNRVWPGTDYPASELTTCMQQVVDIARSKRVIVSLDLHNNTGVNPLYTCIDKVDASTLQLAILFARTVVFFRVPLGVQTKAMADFCPAITCECGKIGDAAGVDRAVELIDACLHMLELPPQWPPASDYHLLHSTAIVKVSAEWSIAFGGPSNGADLQFASEMDLLNFRMLPAGSVFGKRRPASGAELAVLNEQNENIADSIFAIEGDSIILRRSVIPAMLTKNIQIIRDDCLGYLMEEYSITDNGN